MTRREAAAQARQSRRPSRLGSAAGAALKPDRVLTADAGFPGLLNRVWEQAMAAPTLSVAVETLLTLGGHVPADVQLRGLRLPDECALRVVFGRSWRDGDRPGLPGDSDGGPPAFVGDLGLTTGGRVVVRVPSRGALADEDDLVDGVIRMPWSPRALSAYREDLQRATQELNRSVADCREWLATAGPGGRDRLLERLREAALRNAPFVLYQDGKRYTNFRDRNNLTGKTLWPGHPDCALSSLVGMPLDLWSDSDAVMVVCLTLLVRSAGSARIEEANGTQLTIAHIAEILERTRREYNRIPHLDPVPAAASTRVESLNDLAEALRRRRAQIGSQGQLYREIHGPLMHKIERVSLVRGPAADRREEALCARLREHLPVTGETLDQIGASVAASPGWLAGPFGGFGTGFEAVIHETVCAAVVAFDADFAMSRGLRSLPALIRALREESWALIAGWDMPAFFCCVVPAPGAGRYFGDSPAQLADVAWSISARMQYNSWHFLAGNLPPVPVVMARDYFVPPSIPDIAYHSDQHHHGHVAARVRFSIRSPQAVEILGRLFAGFVDLRLLRCDGEPFDEQDLLAAHRASALLARVTGIAAGVVAAGTDIEVTAFDPNWHWATIAAEPRPVGRTPEATLPA